MEDLGQLQAPVKPVKRENTYITEPNGYGEVCDCCETAHHHRVTGPTAVTELNE